MKKVLYILAVLIVAGAIWYFFPGMKEKPEANKPVVFVCLPPYETFAREVAGDLVEVRSLIQPGIDPHTYSPTPRQLTDLSTASVYFSADYPFEETLLARVKDLNPGLKVVRINTGITLRKTEGMVHFETEHDKESHKGEPHHHETDHSADHHEEDHEGEHHHEAGMPDPHTWLSPSNAIIQARTIAETLTQMFPDERGNLAQRLKTFRGKVNSVQNEIAGLMKNVPGHEIMVFHPAYGYLTDEFGLRQIPVEIDGKSPSARELALIIDYARQYRITTIFVQSQIRSDSPEAVAAAIGGKIIRIDPLDPDYLANLRRLAEAFAGVAVE